MISEKKKNSPINNFISNVFVGVVSASFVTILTKLLGNDNAPPLETDFLILNSFQGETILYCSLFSIVLFSFIRVCIAIPTNIISHRRIKNSPGYNRKQFIWRNFRDGYFWGIVNFFGWAGLAYFIHSFEHGTQGNFPHQVFFTIGLLGAAFHHSIAGLTWFLLQEIILGETKTRDVIKLYNLDKKMLIRFYLPRLATAISFGIMMAYISYLFKPDNVYRLVYAHRVEVIVMISIIVIIAYIFVFMLPDNTFFYRSLIYKNIGPIWITLITVLSIGIFTGMEIFELLLKDEYFEFINGR